MNSIRIITVLCLTLLVQGHSHAALMLSQKKAAAIGEEMYQQIVSDTPAYSDVTLTDYVNKIGQLLASHSDSPDTRFTFTVLDSPDINAFATPGAYIYINRGLITYLSSEAQLAAVLAHEIAHITADHASRQQRAKTTSNIAAGVLAILSRSADVGEATALWGAATVSGYGRDMELEADGLGAKFMARAGYDSNAIIDVLTLLKNHERLEKKRARDAGKEPRSYHGLFATHPRSDQRLLEIVRSGTGTTAGEQGVIPFRLATDNLVWGENFQAQLKRPNRYVDEKYLYRLDYPEGWAFSTSLSGASGNSPAGQGTLDLTLKPRTNQAPDQFLKSHFKTGVLRDGQGFTKPGLIGYLALLPRKDGPDKRIAVVYYRRYAYVFEGSLAKSVHNDKQQIQSLDNQLQGIILSFAPLSARQLASQSPKRIHYVKATQHTTFAALAKQLKLGKYGEEELRLINGFYPRGEPEPGSWIKVIQ